ncbi:MAG: FxLYD domain-containing protein [Nitrososphaerales archaeon]
MFSPDGTLLKSTSYPTGFTITDSGKIGFRSSFLDDSLNSVTANITLTDLEKTEAISNTVQTTVPYNDDEDLELLIPNPQGLGSTNSNNANLDNSNNEEIERQESSSQADLNVTSSTAYFEGDNFYIVGEVANNCEEDKEFVKVIATLYDENKSVIGSEYTYTQPSTIPASESSSFKLLICSHV